MVMMMMMMMMPTISKTTSWILVVLIGLSIIGSCVADCNRRGMNYYEGEIMPFISQLDVQCDRCYCVGDHITMCIAINCGDGHDASYFTQVYYHFADGRYYRFSPEYLAGESGNTSDWIHSEEIIPFLPSNRLSRVQYLINQGVQEMNGTLTKQLKHDEIPKEKNSSSGENDELLVNVLPPNLRGEITLVDYWPTVTKEKTYEYQTDDDSGYHPLPVFKGPIFHNVVATSTTVYNCTTDIDNQVILNIEQFNECSLKDNRPHVELPEFSLNRIRLTQNYYANHVHIFNEWVNVSNTLLDMAKDDIEAFDFDELNSEMKIFEHLRDMFHQIGSMYIRHLKLVSIGLTDIANTQRTNFHNDLMSLIKQADQQMEQSTSDVQIDNYAYSTSSAVKYVETNSLADLEFYQDKMYTEMIEIMRRCYKHLDQFVPKKPIDQQMTRCNYFVNNIAEALNEMLIGQIKVYIDMRPKMENFMNAAIQAQLAVKQQVLIMFNLLSERLYRFLQSDTSARLQENWLRRPFIAMRESLVRFLEHNDEKFVAYVKYVKNLFHETINNDGDYFTEYFRNITFYVNHAVYLRSTMYEKYLSIRSTPALFKHDDMATALNNRKYPPMEHPRKPEPVANVSYPIVTVLDADKPTVEFVGIVLGRDSDITANWSSWNVQDLRRIALAVFEEPARQIGENIDEFLTSFYEFDRYTRHVEKSSRDLEYLKFINIPAKEKIQCHGQSKFVFGKKLPPSNRSQISETNAIDSLANHLNRMFPGKNIQFEYFVDRENDYPLRWLKFTYSYTPLFISKPLYQDSTTTLATTNIVPSTNTEVQRTSMKNYIPDSIRTSDVGKLNHYSTTRPENIHQTTPAAAKLSESVDQQTEFDSSLFVYNIEMEQDTAKQIDDVELKLKLVNSEPIPANDKSSVYHMMAQDEVSDDYIDYNNYYYPNEITDEKISVENDSPVTGEKIVPSENYSGPDLFVSSATGYRVNDPYVIVNPKLSSQKMMTNSTIKTKWRPDSNNEIIRIIKRKTTVKKNLRPDSRTKSSGSSAVENKIRKSNDDLFVSTSNGYQVNNLYLNNAASIVAEKAHKQSKRQIKISDNETTIRPATTTAAAGKILFSQQQPEGGKIKNKTSNIEPEVKTETSDKVEKESKLAANELKKRVYNPLMPYPDEYPEEYQTIQNGPALIITRTAYTRIPDVTYTTVTTVTLPTYQLIEKAENGFADTLLDTEDINNIKSNTKRTPEERKNKFPLQENAGGKNKNKKPPPKRVNCRSCVTTADDDDDAGHKCKNCDNDHIRESIKSVVTKPGSKNRTKIITKSSLLKSTTSAPKKITKNPQRVSINSKSANKTKTTVAYIRHKLAGKETVQNIIVRLKSPVKVPASPSTTRKPDLINFPKITKIGDSKILSSTSSMVNKKLIIPSIANPDKIQNDQTTPIFDETDMKIVKNFVSKNFPIP